MQHLIDVRNQLDRYASPQRVDWHFAHINNRWTKRALVSAGFGYPSPQHDDSPAAAISRWKPIFSVADIGGFDSAAAAADARAERKASRDLEAATTQIRQKSPEAETDDKINRQDYGADGRSSDDSIEYAKNLAKSKAYTTGRVAVVHGLNRPLFHIDLTSALQSAIANAERKEAEGLGERADDVNPDELVIAGEH